MSYNQIQSNVPRPIYGNYMRQHRKTKSASKLGIIQGYTPTNIICNKQACSPAREANLSHRTAPPAEIGLYGIQCLQYSCFWFLFYYQFKNSWNHLVLNAHK